MMRRVLICGMLVLLACGTVAADLLEQAKQAYDFENWQGRDGALKQGLRLTDVDLSPCVVMSVRNRLPTSGEMILRYAVEGVGKPAFEVAIKVHDSVLGAQEELIKFLSNCTVQLPRGDAFGLELGDVCFAVKDKDLFSCIAFVRNNIFLRLSIMGAAKTPADISEIAKKIDQQIKQAQETGKAENLNKPVISEFSAANRSTNAHTPVELTLKVSDPKNEDVQIHFDEGGAMVYKHKSKRYFKARIPGKYTLTVYAINRHFLVSKKSVTIEVVAEED